LIIMGYSIGQWVAPWMAGMIFDTYHSYSLAWTIFSASGLLGAGAIYAISSSSRTRPVSDDMLYSLRNSQD
jgi:cyanate permease